MSKIVGRKYPVDDIISFQDDSCFSQSTPFHLFNVDAGLFLADNVKIDYASRISGQLNGIDCYFEKVLTDGVWDNTTVILHVYSIGKKWDTCYFMNNTLYTDNGTRQSHWKFLILDNGDGTFKLRRAEESTNCIGFANSNTNVAIATNLNPSTASNRLNWRITRDDTTMKTFLADTSTNLPLINSAIDLGWIDQSSIELYAEDVTYLPEYTGVETSVFKTNQLVAFNELQYCTQITTIPNYCFDGCSTLTSIKLPTSVTSTGTRSLSNCKALVAFDTRNVETIGTDTFRNDSGLTTITLGDACSAVNGASFLGCTNLTRVNCSSIASWLDIEFASIHATPLHNENAHLYFSNAEATHITIPDNITEIKKNAFYGGRYIEKIIIPESVTSIGVCAFQECSLLKTAGPIGSGCDIEFGWTTKMPSYAFHTANCLEKVIIPSTFTAIKDRSFTYCSSLKCIDLPESCVAIEVEGLKGCTSLESIIIRAGNINIQTGALAGNTSLRRVYFETSTPPKSTSTFMEIASGEAFVWVPKGSKSAYEAFFDGKGYTVKEGEDFSLPLEIIDPVNTELLNIAKSYDWVPNEATYLTTLDCSQVNDSRLAAPGPSGYEDLETFLELKYFLGITTIPANLFSDSSFSGDIIVPDNVIEIGSGAFHGCGTDSKVVINNAYIESDAFTGSNPKEVYLGENVTLEINPFTYCPNTKYYVSEDNSTLKNSRDNNALLSNDTELVSINESLLIPQDITTILPCALQNSSSRLGSLILPRNLILIESMAFENQAYNKVFARTEIPAEINSDLLNTTIGTLYVPEGTIEMYTNSWGNKFTSIGEIKEFKTQKTIPSIRRDIKAKVHDWTVDYERVTSVMCWGQNLKSYFNIDIKANEVGGFSIFGMNCRDWTAGDGFNFLLANEGSNFIIGMRCSINNYTWLHSPVWNTATFHTSLGFTDGSAPQRWVLSVTGEKTIKYNYQSTTIVGNVPKGPVTSNAPVRLMISTAYAQNENSTNWLGIKIYETILYGREENGINNNVPISHLIPVKRKSDNRIGFYDLVRLRFFDSVGANFSYERAISPNDGVEYNWSNSPRTSTRNTNWRYGGHGTGKTIQESNWTPGGGLQCAFWYLTRPGKITFHNTYTHGCDVYLENKDGKRTYSKSCPAKSTTEWNINDVLWENAPYLSMVFWDSPTQDEIKNSGWYFTYTDLEIRYDELPPGYTRLEYIEKRSGTAWIDTGRAGSGGNLIDLKFSLIVENDTKLPFMVGSVGSAPNNNRNIISENTIQKRNSYNNSIASRLPVSEEPHTIIMDTRNTTFTGTLDGEKINVTVPSGTIDANGGNVLVFRNNYNGSTAYYGKIYRLKIWLSADIVCRKDLIPCINDQNEVGLFDLADRIFYGSQTGDTFTAGPIIA